MKVRMIVLVVMMLASATTVFGGGEAMWSYSGDTGPDKWGQLSPSWAICGHGR